MVIHQRKDFKVWSLSPEQNGYKNKAKKKYIMFQLTCKIDDLWGRKSWTCLLFYLSPLEPCVQPDFGGRGWETPLLYGSTVRS